MPVLYDYDLVGVGYRAHTVGYDENGLTFYQFGYPGLDFCFVLHVQRRCRFVQQYNRSVLEQGPRYRYPLTLASGKGFAILSDHGLIAIGHF